MKTLKEFREYIPERHMSPEEKEKKEKYVKGMKKVFTDFEDRYGDDAKAVMYATATKNAMREHTEDETNILLEETEELNETAATRANIPVVLVLKRRALRIYPEGQIVALYHSDKLKKFVTIPFTTVGVGDIAVKD